MRRIGVERRGTYHIIPSLLDVVTPASSQCQGGAIFGHVCLQGALQDPSHQILEPRRLSMMTIVMPLAVVTLDAEEAPQDDEKPMAAIRK